ncbi:hypothetical protein CEXT_535521 [Caerostris extrusa]|uniref:Uncharacterized protein n=1 Tax=Caerostris extrusa TaxID=172846 RepID=A0AAV4R5K2_CAEEX|nr:hypothetical protein CEXT_535521 [Caerostris extrusa]
MRLTGKPPCTACILSPQFSGGTPQYWHSKQLGHFLVVVVSLIDYKFGPRKAFGPDPSCSSKASLVSFQPRTPFVRKLIALPKPLRHFKE